MTEEEQENQDEVEPLRMARNPNPPSASDVGLRDRTHIPFRDWCAHCVRGKSKSDPHRQIVRDSNEIPELSLDYMYMDSGNNEEQRGMPILVARDRKT